MYTRRKTPIWSTQGPGEIVILDNRDSFVFNLAHRFAEIGQKASVVRSDEIEVEELEELQPAAIVVSPGPGHPVDAGISIDAIRRFSGKIPILGVCLGHQAIAVAFGGTVKAGGAPVHGMASTISHDGTGIFDGLEDEFSAARYHSLIVRRWPNELVANAWTGQFVMGLQHHKWPIFGVQFHPESVLTPLGCQLLRNFARHVQWEEAGQLLR